MEKANDGDNADADVLRMADGKVNADKGKAKVVESVVMQK